MYYYCLGQGTEEISELCDCTFAFHLIKGESCFVSRIDRFKEALIDKDIVCRGKGEICVSVLR